MELFIKKPNLPQGKVKSVLLGAAWPSINHALESIGIMPICIPDNDGIDVPVRAHADMSAYYCGSGRLVISRNIIHKCKTDMFPANFNISESAEKQYSQYPLDIGMNACEIGDFIICKKCNTDSAILSHAAANGKIIIDVNQGYSKCSVCILDEKHIITADSSIAKRAGREGIDVLLITPGFFELPGYDHGFIGGSCFKSRYDTIAFTGTLSGHPDERRIIEYIEKLGINLVYLTNERCIDIGSIIPLTEER